MYLPCFYIAIVKRFEHCLVQWKSAIEIPCIIIIIIIIIMKRKLSYYGHTRRHHSMQKLIVEGKVEGKRGRGRRRKSWTGNIAEMIGECVNVCGELALDRTRWRTMASNLYKETDPRWIYMTTSVKFKNEILN